MKILVVEDDLSLNKIITRRLSQAGYEVDSCTDGEAALNQLSSKAYDCAILDWMLPKLDGLSVIREYKKWGKATPIIMLTAKDSISNRVEGLDSGADDYLIKPFAFDELLARIRVMTRRKTRQSAADTNLSIGDLILDRISHKVTRNNKEIKLTSKEFALLEFFLNNQEVVLSRDQIAVHVWNNDFDYDSNIVDVYIRYLRNKIDKDFEYPLLHTVRGFGYVMKVEQ